MRRLLTSACLSAFVLLCATATASAATILVSLDTSSLSTVTGPFTLDFQLNDGDGVSNTTVTLSDFDFGGGGLTGSPTLNGGASVDGAGVISLVDTGFFNAFAQDFVPGSVLSFSITFVSTSPANPADIPDQFSFAILNADLFTSGVAGELLSIDFASMLILQTFDATDAAGAPLLAAPAATVVPEPGTLSLVALGLAGAAIRRRRRTSC